MKRALLRPEKTIDNAAEEEYYIAYKTGRYYKQIKDTDEMNRQAFREAFRRSIPILCSYGWCIASRMRWRSRCIRAFRR